ncbi:MAG: hypothetical protein H0V09_03600, partial [Gemmatimonadetes bacterium]|nr:hypothetical protein [Gemmatimonadota bacterium]
KGAPNAPELADGINVSFTSQTENAANASTLFGVNGTQISGEGFVGGTLNVRG